jgi:hypothetical protein
MPRRRVTRGDARRQRIDDERARNKPAVDREALAAIAPF